MYKYTVTFLNKWNSFETITVLAFNAHNAYEKAMTELGSNMIRITDIKFGEWK